MDRGCCLSRLGQLGQRAVHRGERPPHAASAGGVPAAAAVHGHGLARAGERVIAGGGFRA